MLRDTRRAPATGEFVVVSGADPLNLVGTLLPGAKVPALTGNRVLYRDGEPIGALVAGELRWFTALDTAALRKAEDHLVTGRAAAVAA
jgi:ATP-dependent Lhr-like helicase